MISKMSKITKLGREMLGPNGENIAVRSLQIWYMFVLIRAEKNKLLKYKPRKKPSYGTDGFNFGLI